MNLADVIALGVTPGARERLGVKRNMTLEQARARILGAVGPAAFAAAMSMPSGIKRSVALLSAHKAARRAGPEEKPGRREKPEPEPRGEESASCVECGHSQDEHPEGGECHHGMDTEEECDCKGFVSEEGDEEKPAPAPPGKKPGAPPPEDAPTKAMLDRISARSETKRDVFARVHHAQFGHERPAKQPTPAEKRAQRARELGMDPARYEASYRAMGFTDDPPKGAA